MILTMEYVVTYKDAPGGMQQRATFPNRDVALKFAVAVEKDGGIAVFTSGYKAAPTSPLPKYVPPISEFE